MLRFEWDDQKNVLNIMKHGIDFHEAVTVFLDEDGLIINDPEHSEKEERFIIIGVSNKGNILIVCHCYRENDEVIRLISARKATKRETKQYLERIGL